jgi:alpha-galactosidase
MNQNLATPPAGWNSFDSFGGYLHEAAAFAQLEAQAQKLLPSGYDTFVVDIGWYGEYDLKPGTLLPMPRSKHAARIHLDSYGRPLPSRTYFSQGFGALVGRTHALGMKFGLHLMRGIPRQAVEARLPIEGTHVTAADIADRSSTCPWCHYNYGVDMRRAGAQEYYDSLVAQLAEWGVDFIKADDITAYPMEIEAIALAIKKAGRPIALSLSHGGEAELRFQSSYEKADLVRITKDIWDDIPSIERSFEAWAYWRGATRPGFWPDLDMIPFGDLQTMSPEPLPGELAPGENPSLCGKGYRRRCKLSLEERRTFMTQRAMAASPLFVGGDLTTLPKEDWQLLANPEMLACNRNGVSGHLLYARGDVQVWQTPHRTAAGDGWLGIFNRNPARERERIALTPERLGLPPHTMLYDIWNDAAMGRLEECPEVELAPVGCCFIAYSAEPHAGSTT